VEVRSLLRPDAASPYDAHAFDAAGLGRPASSEPRPARLALGARLFVATELSGDGSRSCASCHQPGRFFTDGRARSATIPGSPAARLRNAPTLLNSAMQGAQFADGRVVYLEDQIAQVVGSPSEMHGTLEGAAARMAGDSAWLQDFRRAFPEESTPVGGMEIRLAIASYVRSLVALDSPFDRYVRGDRGALTAKARRGFSVFMGKGKCGSCHFAPLFNGTVPPGYQDQEYEIIGVPDRRGSSRVDPDSGRVAVTRSALNRFAFKSPTVRNAAHTAPYMHNGVFATLDQVIDFYEKGGGVGLGMALPNQTLPFDRLRLTARDKRDLRSFIEALTDSVPRSPES
jgi:cytochrome c peroxidase